MCGKLPKMHAPGADGMTMCGKRAMPPGKQGPAVAKDMLMFESLPPKKPGHQSWQPCKNCKKRIADLRK